jgi:hypothetical protein
MLTPNPGAHTETLAAGRDLVADFAFGVDGGM